VVELVCRECTAMRFAPRQCSLNVPVALSEALSNAMLRGNRDDPRKHVLVRVRVDSNALIVDVSDEGAGFNIDACIIDPTAPDRLTGEQGRGLFLMRKLMDQVECIAEGSRNVVRMTLRRAS
jgi:serine/threonine-protein kinase RsbW